MDIQLIGSLELGGDQGSSSKAQIHIGQLLQAMGLVHTTPNDASQYNHTNENRATQQASQKLSSSYNYEERQRKGGRKEEREEDEFSEAEKELNKRWSEVSTSPTYKAAVGRYYQDIDASEQQKNMQNQNTHSNSYNNSYRITSDDRRNNRGVEEEAVSNTQFKVERTLPDGSIEQKDWDALLHPHGIHERGGDRGDIGGGGSFRMSGGALSKTRKPSSPSKHAHISNITEIEKKNEIMKNIISDKRGAAEEENDDEKMMKIIQHNQTSTSLEDAMKKQGDVTSEASGSTPPVVSSLLNVTNNDDYMLDAINEEESLIENSVVESVQGEQLELEIDEVFVYTLSIHMLCIDVLY